MSNRSRVIAAVVACVVSLGALPAMATVVNYNFAAVDGQSTPVTLQGATFSSPSDVPGAGAYTFGPNGGLFSALGSEVLSSAGTVAELEISFAQPQIAVSFDFALGDFFALGGSDTLTVTTNSGAVLPFTASLVDGDFYPEGSANISGVGPITSIDLTSAYPIIIADLTSVPEPASVALVGIGLLALTVLRRRAR